MGKRDILMLVIGIIIGGVVVWAMLSFGLGMSSTQIGKVTETKITTTNGLTKLGTVDNESLYRDPKTQAMYLQTTSGIVELPNWMNSRPGGSSGYLFAFGRDCSAAYVYRGSRWRTYCATTGSCSGGCVGEGEGINRCICSSAAQ